MRNTLDLSRHGDEEAIVDALSFGEKWSEENPVELETARKKLERVAQWMHNARCDAGLLELVRTRKIGISIDEASDELIFHTKADGARP